MLITVISFFISFAHAVGFESGNIRTVVPIEGTLKVRCLESTAPEEVTFSCRDRVMDPSPYDYFIGPAIGNYSRLKLELESASPDKSKRFKSTDYSIIENRSSERINLWISNLFQKPLLKVGANAMTYRFLDYKNNVVTQGNFEVTVNLGSTRRCPDASHISYKSSDCASQYSFCQEYFANFNYCK
ncbi:MAG: hypothetical protein ACLGGX_02830 [Bdellovibrionia bacterium]